MSVVKEKKRVKGRAPKDLMDKVISKLQRMRPKDDKDGTFEIRRTTEQIVPRVRFVLKTGIPPLDELTGHICFGRVTEVYGMEASGKTALVRQCLIQAQRREIYEVLEDADGKMNLKQIGEDVAVFKIFLDNEHSIDQDDKMVFFDPIKNEDVELDCGLGDCDTVDQMFKIIDNTINTVEEVMKEQENKDKYRDYVIVIVTDTIAGTASKEEMAMEWGTDDYTRQPKQLRQGFRRLTRQIGRHNVAAIFTNQVSDKFQKKVRSYGNSSTPQDVDFSTFGGKALKYYSSLRIFMWKDDRKYVLVPGAKFAAGFLIGFHTTKNRRVKPLREGRLALIFEGGRGLDPIFSLLESLIYLGFAEIPKGPAPEIRFKFSKWQVPMTTFGASRDAGAELEKEDDRGKKIEPSIEQRAEWPKFYADHRVDIDALWRKAIEFAFSTEGINTVTSVVEDQEDDIDYAEDSHAD